MREGGREGWTAGKKFIKCVCMCVGVGVLGSLECFDGCAERDVEMVGKWMCMDVPTYVIYIDKLRIWKLMSLMNIMRLDGMVIVRYLGTDRIVTNISPSQFSLRGFLRSTSSIIDYI